METKEIKKVYKLKTWPKVLVVSLLIICFVVPFGWKKYQDYLYTKTYEYAFLKLGYSKEESDLFQEKLNKKEIEKVLGYKYNEFLSEFVNTKYFIFDNLDGYLSQVITQEENFFKYHGTDGYNYDEIVSLVNVRAIDDAYTNPTKTNIEENYAMLVNKYYELGEDYEPDDLVDVDIKYYYGGPKKVRREAYEAFKRMWDGANREGIYLIIDSAYRSYKSQLEVYKEYENNKGTKFADSIAARPGFSEHQTGLALDIYAKECTSAKTFKDSKAYAWLIANSYKYGFILRYPDGKNKLTGYNYESWHYRYLGEELALKVYESGLTYDEYYSYYLARK